MLARASTPTIFVVDDDAGLLVLIEGALRAEKWNVATAASGAAALAWLQKNSADLLLLDLKLRDMEAREFIGAMADINRSIPFIVITGQGDERVAVEMMKRGALDYLVKDVNFIDLIPTVARRNLDNLAVEERLAGAEEALRDRAEELAAILDAVPTPVLIAHDPDCLHITGNRAADALLLNPRGAEASLTAPGEIRPHRFRAFKDGRELSKDELPAHRAARGFAVQGFEFTLTFDNSASRHVLGYGEPLRDDAGRPRGAIGVLVDITDRKQAEESLRQSEERYRTLFTTLLEGFCIIEVIFDAQGRSVDYRFLEVNPAFEKQTGLRDAEGKLMRDLAPDHEGHWFDIYGRIALTGEPARFENEARALNRWYEVSAFRFGGAGSRKVAVLFNDITERKRLEREIIEISERERRNFGQDLHDGLGQRLTGLEMLSHALAADLKPHALAAAKEALRLNRELRKTVTEARLISHGLAPVSMEGEGLMHGLKTLAASTSRISKVACRFTCHPPVYIEDVTTATHLYRIAQEAVNNALKHGRAKEVHIALAENSEGVELAIENNGRVFPKAHPEQGGMGLNVMRYRAEMIGATLSIESGGRKGVQVICNLRRKT